MSDPGLYRTKEEVEAAKKQDCLLVTQQQLEAAGVPASEFSKFEDSVREEVEDAVRFADESPVLPVERLEEFNYAE